MFRGWSSTGLHLTQLNRLKLGGVFWHVTISAAIHMSSKGEDIWGIYTSYMHRVRDRRIFGSVRCVYSTDSEHTASTGTVWTLQVGLVYLRPWSSLACWYFRDRNRSLYYIYYCIFGNTIRLTIIIYTQTRHYSIPSRIFSNYIYNNSSPTATLQTAQPNHTGVVRSASVGRWVYPTCPSPINPLQFVGKRTSLPTCAVLYLCLCVPLRTLVSTFPVQ